MADQFVGMTMLVTLSSPPDTQLRGKVSNVVAGKSITLSNVYCPGNGRHITEITIQASDVQDLVEVSDENSPPAYGTTPTPTGHYQPPPPFHHVQPTISPAPAVQAVPPGQKPKTFEDPAIVSVGRPPMSRSATGSATNIHSHPPVRKPPTSQQTTPTVLQPPKTILTRETAAPERRVTPAAVLVDPMEKMKIRERDIIEDDEDDENLSEEVEVTIVQEPVVRRRTRRSRAHHKKTRHGADDEGYADEVTPASQTKPGKGWRQTPLLAPNPSFQPFTTLKKRAKQGKLYDNGWATEDATDVQDMGDFDFESNLSKFDKRTVFDSIRAEDMTADEDRLVGHNRLPRPGTMGGRNLHPTENVLDQIKESAQWNSEAGDSEMDLPVSSQRGSGSGRASRRGNSLLRKPTSLKNMKDSSLHASQTRAGVTVSATGLRAERSRSQQPAKSAFHFISSSRRCEVASALQMLNIENIAQSELGLSEDMMTENAGRGLAEVTLGSLKEGRGRGKLPSLPYVVVYAGNNKSGQRAIAAARHLKNHGASVVVVMLGLEREAELLDGVRRQLKVFRAFSGKVISKAEMLEWVKTLSGEGDARVEIIIDGLLGLALSFEELRTSEQAAVFELIEWSNRSRAQVIAVDIPSGIDPATGRVQIVDGAPLCVHASSVVAMGAPKTGLLKAMEGNEEPAPLKGREGVWRVWVVDLGLGRQAWKRSGMRVRRGVEFEGRWCVEMRFVRGLEGGDA